MIAYWRDGMMACWHDAMLLMIAVVLILQCPDRVKVLCWTYADDVDDVSFPGMMSMIACRGGVDSFPPYRLDRPIINNTTTRTHPHPITQQRTRIVCVCVCVVLKYHPATRTES